jgi:undecaprenol kinase/diacylglycerol kinase (ATP)
MLRTQHNSWIHSAAAFCAIVLGFILEIKTNEWLWIIACIVLVFAAELFNTAIEKMADSVWKEKNINAKHCKDAAAGAVLITSIGALIIGLIIFLPKIF